MRRQIPRISRALALVAVTAGGTLALAPDALAGNSASPTATATLTAGALGINGAPNFNFGSTALTGANLSVSASEPIDVGDATGSGLGWNLTATSTTFTAGAHTIGSAPVAATLPTVACDAGVTCSVATVPGAGAVSYPYTIPSAGTAPTATKMFNAAAGSGMANQTVTVPWTLAVPANVYAGAYASTWTLTLASAP